MRRLARQRRPDAAQDRAADHPRALAQTLQPDLPGIDPVGAGEVVGVGLVLAGAAGLCVQHLLHAAELQGALGGGVREQALLDRHRGARADGRGPFAVQRGLAPGRGGRLGAAVLPLVGTDGAGRVLEALAGHRVDLRQRAQVRVGVAVAVDVLEPHVEAQALAVPDLLDTAVVHGHHGGAAAREDVDVAARVVGLDHVDRGPRTAQLAVPLREVVRVPRACIYGEARLGQSGQRTDQVGGHAGDQPGAEHHRVDVPVGVVVGEDRAPHVLLVAGRVQVAGRGEDRVDRVVGILAPVLVAVGPVHLPGRGHELHPADGAGGGHVQVAAVVGLDLVDRRQDLPADPVLDAGGLVDREQEDRHPELADHEVGDAGPERGAGQGVHEARVGRRRGAVGPADRGALGDRAAGPVIVLVLVLHRSAVAEAVPAVAVVLALERLAHGRELDRLDRLDRLGLLGGGRGGCRRRGRTAGAGCSAGAGTVAGASRPGSFAGGVLAGGMFGAGVFGGGAGTGSTLTGSPGTSSAMS